MIDQRYLGGEAGHRSLWGGVSTRKARNVGLAIVGAATVIVVPLVGYPGLALCLISAAAVYVFTTETHRGTPWERWMLRREWRAREAAGLNRFRPVDRRPPELHAAFLASKGRARASVAGEWNTYRDWPDGAEGMRWLLRKPHVPGIAWHAPTGEDAWLSVVFPLGGQISGIQGDDVVNARSRAFGRLLGSLGMVTALAKRIQILTHIQPIDTAAHESWIADEVDLEAPEELLRSYKEVIDRLGGGGLMQRHYAVVRWPLSPRFLRLAERKAPGRDGWILLMGQEIDAAWREMYRAKLDPGRALSAAQTAAVLRHLQMPSWPMDQAGDVDPENPWLESDQGWSWVTVADQGPDGLEETWFHRTAELPVRAMETSGRNALWMLPLLSQLPRQRVVRTISVQLEGVPQQTARSQARVDLTSDLAEESARARKGVLSDDDLDEGLTAARARVRDLKPGKGHHGLEYVIHVTVSSETEVELRSACELLTEAAHKAGVRELRWLDTQQAGAHACTWPLARGMKPARQTAGAWAAGVLAGTGPKEELM
ncbi:hypothetical protein [Nocardioides sp. GXZ039]|uniref:hypothetical protein n=1 Tax=Nocardioides sp. GXZ039 TaxID=3136018 RepID=UPI0030F3E2AF